MSMTAHLMSLREKHALLENRITDESHHPMPDFAVITQLKKQKLILKEQISSLILHQRRASTA